MVPIAKRNVSSIKNGFASSDITFIKGSKGEWRVTLKFFMTEELSGKSGSLEIRNDLGIGNSNY